MTYESKELSTSDGRPVELLRIKYGATGEWNYTTCEEDVLYDSRTYTPLAIDHGKLEPTGDASRSSLDISVPQDAPVGDLFRVQPPSGLVIVDLFGHHYDDGTGDDSFVVLWKGRITTVNWKDAWLHLTVENVFSSLQRTGLRRRYSTQCPYALYGLGCTVDKALHKEELTISVVSGNTVTSANAVGFADNFFAGGMIEWTHPERDTTERIMVRSSNGTTGVLTLTAQPVGLEVDAIVFAYPGCDHSIATCNTKFGNSLNYGGQPFRPLKNPFGGSMIY